MKGFRMKCFSILVYPVILVSLSAAQDPCREYMYINIGNARRSVEYQHLNLDNPICDFHVTENATAWYRFRFFEGERLPEECVSRLFCGTENPIWMLGSHPSVVGETVVRTACANVGPPGDCCGWSETMSVRKCRDGLSEYFVYQLPRPRDCPMSYCTEGGPAPCPPGHTWDPSKGECIVGTTLPTPSTTTSSVHPTPRPNDNPGPESNGVSIGLIIGLCFATAVGGGMVAVTVFWVFCKRPSKIDSVDNKDEANPPPYTVDHQADSVIYGPIYDTKSVAERNTHV